MHQLTTQPTRDAQLGTIYYNGKTSKPSTGVAFCRNMPNVNNMAIRTMPVYHKGYDSLQYPLFHCKGQGGLQYERKENLRVHRNYELIRRIYCKLWQYIVDLICLLEFERLRYIENNQKTLRADKYEYIGVKVGETMVAEQRKRGNIQL